MVNLNFSSTVVGNPPPTTWTMWHDNPTINIVNPILVNLGGLQMYGFWNHQDPAADGDEFEHIFYLKSGNYNLNLMWRLGPGRGIVDLYIDGNLVGSQDGYAAVATYNVVQTTTPVAVATDGMHTLRGRTNGKNGASTGFRIALTKIWLDPV
jgi:hypothetical protein